MTPVPPDIVSPRQRLRDALRWLSEIERHDPAAIEEACRRFDLSPMDEDFLLREAARIRRRAGHPRPDEEQP
jgi:hypothetical protein